MRMYVLAVIILVAITATGHVTMAHVGTATTVDYFDDFENGIIDRNLWAMGGGGRGWQANAPINDGGWSYAHQEIRSLADGYLCARVWGPTSANTYGGEAWIQTQQNFNDGKSHLIRFKWEAEVVIKGHQDRYYIQVTDGYVPGHADLHWPERRPPIAPVTREELAGTFNFLWTMHPDGVWRAGWALEQGMAPTEMFLRIAPDGTTRLYFAANTESTISYETVLDRSRPWHLRFMVSDGTSMGFSGGDDRLRLYSFSAVTIP